MPQVSSTRQLLRSDPVVLLAEDDPLLRPFVGDQLRLARFFVLEATSGEEALELLSGGQEVDLLLTDIQMEGQLTGWDLAEGARALMPALPVIYTSSGRCEPLRLVEGGRFIAKPCRISDLVALAKSATQSD